MNDDLRAIQAERLAAVDPLLPPLPADPTDGEAVTLTATLAGGAEVRGLLRHQVLQPGTPFTLWSAMSCWELFPQVGAEPGAGMAALTQAWRRHMETVERQPDDSACLVRWPSRDTVGSGPLLRRGFLPVAVLAVRTGGAEPFAAPDITVRRATLGDLDAAVRIAMAEMSYSVSVGNTVLRPDAADIRRTSLARRINQGDPILLAELDGEPVGLADCSVHESDPVRGWSLVPAGRWGYVGMLSVLPGVRGSGVGRALVAVAHREFANAGATGSYLYYNPPNPLSSVFWPRQGYRPLWTTWELRPAWALR